jgi:methionyl aminopeptidase
VVAIEPMIVAGRSTPSCATTSGRSRPSDGADSAHWEHSVAVHDDGIWVLTAEDGGAAGLAPSASSPAPIA